MHWVKRYWLNKRAKWKAITCFHYQLYFSQTTMLTVPTFYGCFSYKKNNCVLSSCINLSNLYNISLSSNHSPPRHHDDEQFNKFKLTPRSFPSFLHLDFEATIAIVIIIILNYHHHHCYYEWNTYKLGACFYTFNRTFKTLHA